MKTASGASGRSATEGKGPRRPRTSAPCGMHRPDRPGKSPRRGTPLPPRRTMFPRPTTANGPWAHQARQAAASQAPLGREDLRDHDDVALDLAGARPRCVPRGHRAQKRSGRADRPSAPHAAMDLERRIRHPRQHLGGVKPGRRDLAVGGAAPDPDAMQPPASGQSAGRLGHHGRRPGNSRALGTLRSV